jgi:hypothetical protein
MLGFTGMLVLTNDCTDHSPELLDALAAAGWLDHLRVAIPPGEAPARHKLDAAHAHPLVRGAEWTLVCDDDEFLVIHRGDGRIGSLLPARGADFLGMSVNWRVFGSSGEIHWRDELTTRRFLYAARREHATSRWFKSAFRRPELFTCLGVHAPRHLVPSVAGRAGAPEMAWVTAEGRPFPLWGPDGHSTRWMEGDLQSFAAAQINHYMVRSAESFEMKRGTASAAALRDRYTDAYFRRHDRNECFDDSVLDYAAAFDRVFAEAMALPGVRRLHDLCCADYVAALNRKLGRDPAADPRLRLHLDRAG